MKMVSQGSGGNQILGRDVGNNRGFIRKEDASWETPDSSPGPEEQGSSLLWMLKGSEAEQAPNQGGL